MVEGERGVNAGRKREGERQTERDFYCEWWFSTLSFFLSEQREEEEERQKKRIRSLSLSLTLDVGEAPGREKR